MIRNLLVIFLLGIISCTSNSTEDSFATPSTTGSILNIQCSESEQILLQSTKKMLQKLNFSTVDLSQAIAKFQSQNKLKITGKLNSITYSILLEQFFQFKIGEEIYAIEQIKCEKYGQWVQLYKGVINKVADNAIEVKLKQRFGIKHHPHKHGISNTDWFCVPKRKYCYSEITFHAWQGKYNVNDNIKFSKTNIFLAKAGIITGIEEILKVQCKQ